MDLEALDPFLPPDTRPLVEKWLAPHAVRLVVKRPRKTKRGDFTPPQRGKMPTLTVNADLSPLQFMLTLTHEIAHLMVWAEKGNTRRPHGAGWKRCFGRLLDELATVDSLPAEYREAIGAHGRNPKSSAHCDVRLLEVLRRLEGGDDHWLDDVSVGGHFSFRGRRFEKLKSNRSRCLCRDLDDGQKYHIAKTASVVALSA